MGEGRVVEWRIDQVLGARPSVRRGVGGSVRSGAGQRRDFRREVVESADLAGAG